MLEPGDSIDIWVVEKTLGRGGTGSVYRCHNRASARILAAIKLLDPSFQHHPVAKERFVREAEILFTLDHPNIVKMRSLRLDALPPYLEMEFVEGKSLEQLLWHGPMAINRTLSLLQQLVSSVQYLHEREIYHRDIKPANLLIRNDGQLKLVDFGLAMEYGAERITHQQNNTLGTVSYAPPEWVNPDLLDPKLWDIYAIGVVLYEMLTGAEAYPLKVGDSLQQALEVMKRKGECEFLDPGLQIGDDLRELVRRMTHRDPQQRINDLKDVLKRLKRSAAVVRSDLPLDLDMEDEDFLYEPVPSDMGIVINREPDTSMADSLTDATEEEPNTYAQTASVPPSPSPKNAFLRVWGPWVFMLGTLAAMFSGAIIVAILAVVFLGWGGVTDVELQVTSLSLPEDDDQYLGLRVGGVAPIGHEGNVFQFRDVSSGSSVVQWAVGPRCASTRCPGDGCSLWCTIGEQEVDIPGGDLHQLDVEIEEPRSRKVEVNLGNKALASQVSMTFDARKVKLSSNGYAEIPRVAPGEYQVVVDRGQCPIQALGCLIDGSCPEGCESLVKDVVVPAGEGTHPLVLALSEFEGEAVAVEPKPEDRPRPTPNATPEPAQDTEPEPQPAPKAGNLVSKAQYAAWIKQNSAWAPGKQQAKKQADGNYLKGWSGRKPNGAGPVVWVSWSAASAYCSSRGGLASVDASPQTWEGRPLMEWRSMGGKRAWHRGDGTTSSKVSGNHTDANIGFRCAW